MNDPVRQHQVPEFYLRRFAQGELVTRRGRDGSNRDIGVDDATVQKDFYTFPGPDGAPVYELERYLDRYVERPGSAAIARIAEGTAAEGDLEALLWFVAFQVLRSPRVRARDGELTRSLFPKAFAAEKVSQRFGREGSEAWDQQKVDAYYQEMHNIAERVELPEPDIGSSIRVMLRLVEPLHERLWDLMWQVAVAERPVFCTSDNPVAFFRPLADPGGYRGVTIDAQTEIRFPLDPRHLLLGTTRRIGDDRIQAPSELVTQTNRLTAIECQRAIFHLPNNEPPGALPLAAQPPPLPEPTVTIKHAPGTQQTEPTFPKINDPALAALVEQTQESPVHPDLG